MAGDRDLEKAASRPANLSQESISSSHSLPDDEEATLMHDRALASDDTQSQSWLRSLGPKCRKLPVVLAVMVCTIASVTLWTARPPHGWYQPGSYEAEHRALIAGLFRDRPVTCANPYDESGYLNYDELDPLQARWEPFLPDCPPPPDYLELLRLACPTDKTGTRDSEVFKTDQLRFRHYNLSGEPERRFRDMTVQQIEQTRESQEAFAKLSWLQNKTILILGDSVDRNALEQLAIMTDHTFTRTSYQQWNNETNPDGWDERGLPHRIHYQRLNLWIISHFFYGADDTDVFEVQGDWHRPGKFEDRFDRLFKPFIEDMLTSKRSPDFVSFHSATWDMARQGRIDKSTNKSTELPLTTEQRAWHRRRYTEMVTHVLDAWPETPMRIRGVHRVGEQHAQATGDFDWQTNNRINFTNFFTDVRVHQLAGIMEAVARSVEVPYYDLAHVWEGHQDRADGVHPKLYCGGAAINQPLFHHIWLSTLSEDDDEFEPRHAPHIWR
ncbi:uncharacterized protein L969DRAFT_105011 [Mixia osmundae IAM 14324]|uniref:Uncharacterized protein n=1 Tax=Mixia osmundae (strain CBS 9802 / IAM 14324 / JCM 22182 / KY 12970) TaxID=764103 RepID=G7E4Z5_MIXOS|nr:uncharacterized protein L969DRAFT_105011 [Mixia osmundae IAM 14324]KEI37766.1 hypothetical protein L969DRAFT_105011 [Mixia osmundae IAM 14324]GAA97905.1 hypothetical protein E5Q_04585 [Mixia osmundae IAM 14324]